MSSYNGGRGRHQNPSAAPPPSYDEAITRSSSDEEEPLAEKRNGPPKSQEEKEEPTEDDALMPVVLGGAASDRTQESSEFQPDMCQQMVASLEDNTIGNKREQEVDETDIDIDAIDVNVRPPSVERRISQMDIEEGDPESDRRQQESRWYHWRDWSAQKRIILGFSVVFVVLLVGCVALLPPSFVYVDYDKYAFSQDHISGIDYDHVYDYGCYLLGPHVSLVTLPATALFVEHKLWVFDKGGLIVGLDIYLQYFLRPKELASLYQKYNEDYHTVISGKAESIIKNAAILFTLDELRLNRSVVEAKLFNELRYGLAGDCCENLKNPRFPLRGEQLTCNADPATCSRGFFVDIGYFQMGAIRVPDTVMERFMWQIVLQLEAEKELHIQKKAIAVKVTSRIVQSIENEAEQIRKAAEAEALVIKAVAEASMLQEVDLTYINSLKKVYNRLNITDEKAKTSLLYLHTLKDMTLNDKLVAFSYDYDKETLSASP